LAATGSSLGGSTSDFFSGSPSIFSCSLGGTTSPEEGFPSTGITSFFSEGLGVESAPFLKILFKRNLWAGLYLSSLGSFSIKNW